MPACIATDEWKEVHFRPKSFARYHRLDPGLIQDNRFNAIDQLGWWIFTLKGLAVYSTPEGDYSLFPGTVFVMILPCEGHLVQPKESTEWEYLSVQVAGRFGVGAFEQMQSKYGVIHKLPLRCSLVNATLRLVRMVKEQPQRPADLWASKMYGWFHCWRQSAARHARRLDSLDHKPHALKTVPTHFNSFKEYAQAFGYSPGYLAQKMKKCWKRRVYPLLHEARLREAARLLTHTDCTVEEVSRKVGYARTSAFSRAFKQFWKQPPTFYRRHSR